jgi:hypothetical protein
MQGGRRPVPLQRKRRSGIALIASFSKMEGFAEADPVFAIPADTDRPLRLTEFAIAIGHAMNAALQAARNELFLDLTARRCRPARPKSCCFVSRTSSNF